jgi:hypothetical protein
MATTIMLMIFLDFVMDPLLKKILLIFYIRIANESKLYFINVILWCLLVQSYQISLHIDLGHAFFFALQHSIQIPINFP